MNLTLACLLALTPVALAQAPASSSNAGHGPTYRLNYTVTESDAGKRLGVQHFSFTLDPSTNYGSLKLGSKVPVTTGSYSGGNNPVQTQFTFIDVGLNIRARLEQRAGAALLLESQVEQSSVTDSVALNSNTVHQPVIRQAVLQNTAELTLGKTVMLGALDTPGSTRHLDIEVLLEAVK